MSDRRRYCEREQRVGEIRARGNSETGFHKFFDPGYRYV